MTLIMGIDPGSLVTGYGLVTCDRRQIQLLTCGSIKASSKQAFPIRLKAIFDRVSALIQEYQPNILAVEDIFYARNVKSVLKLGQVRGVVMLAGTISEVSIVEYPPRVVKMAVTGNGGASKEQVYHAVIRILNIQNLSEVYDVTDALAIAICQCHRL